MQGICEAGAGVSWYIGPRPGEPRKGLWISEGPHRLLFFGGYFQLKSSIFREVSVCLWGPKAVLFCLVKFLLETQPLCKDQGAFNLGL